MHHVIEHCKPGVALDLLKAILDSLRPGGCIVVQTPNMSAVCANVTRFVEITHVTGYTESSLHQILGMAGFADLRVFGSRTPVRVGRRLILLGLRAFSRQLWKLMLLAELGTDVPRILSKNVYVYGRRPA